MRSQARLIVMLMMAVGSFGVNAQVGNIVTCASMSGVVAISPAAPETAQPVTITVAAGVNVGAQSVVAAINANTIDVTLTGVFVGLSPPAQCGVVVVGPLAAGTYTVNYFRSLDGAPATLQASTAFTVASIIPTTAPLVTVLTGVVLGLAALWRLKRRAQQH